jgi:hypothetical protein
VAAHSGSSCARRSGLASPNARPRRAPLPDLGRARPPASGDDEGPRPTSHAALLRPQRRDACSVPNAWATCSGTASLADVGGGHFRDAGEGLPVPGPGRICRRPAGMGVMAVGLSGREMSTEGIGLQPTQLWDPQLERHSYWDMAQVLERQSYWDGGSIY